MSSVHDSSAQMAIDLIASAATDMIEGIYSSLSSVGSALTDVWEALRTEGVAPRSADLTAVRVAVTRELATCRELLNGAGVVMAEACLADRLRYIEWWRFDWDDDTHRLILDLNPDSEFFYDYPHMEWFTIPRDRNERSLYGPYLDYTGVELYVCTFAVPVRLRDGAFLGIAGADLPVDAIEAKLLAKFNDSRNRLVLANADGRVIMGNDPEYTTGSKIKESAVAGRTPVRGTPWSLILL